MMWKDVSRRREEAVEEVVAKLQARVVLDYQLPKSGKLIVPGLRPASMNA
jgi:hypothetical protein